ncbi:MAG: hypothetical protein GX966_00510 [Jeotgalicoccus halophilus]|nr:hypothetical protein [Jeotgalicoccus aerolatus]
MQTSYHTKDNQAYQKVMVEINSSKEEIFAHLATTKGIQEWFPELSFKGPKRMVFNLGNDEYAKMDVLRYDNPNFIHFTWDTGEVEILLEDAENSTQLILNERLPSSFDNVARDFAGWQFKTESIKSIAEGGEALEIDKDTFTALQKDIEKQLDL